MIRVILLILKIHTDDYIFELFQHIFTNAHLATIDPFKEATRPAAEEAEKGANPCIGLTGKRLKKCKAV